MVYKQPNNLESVLTSKCYLFDSFIWSSLNWQKMWGFSLYTNNGSNMIWVEFAHFVSYHIACYPDPTLHVPLILILTLTLSLTLTVTLTLSYLAVVTQACTATEACHSYDPHFRLFLCCICTCFFISIPNVNWRPVGHLETPTFFRLNWTDQNCSQSGY